MYLFDKDCDKVVEVEIYFLLLCKLYYSKEYYGKKDISFFYRICNSVDWGNISV